MPTPKKKAYFNKSTTKNLIQNMDLTPEERKAILKKAQEGATAAARKKKTMREVAKLMLETELVADDALREELKERGFRDFTESAAVLLAQLNRARSGDTEAAKFIRDTSGQRPADQLAVGGFDDLPFDRLDLSELPDNVLLHLIEQRGGLDALTK